LRFWVDVRGTSARFQPFLRFWEALRGEEDRRGVCAVSTLLEILAKGFLTSRIGDFIIGFNPS